jgi:DNA ligase-1
MALYVDVAVLGERLAGEASRLAKRDAIAAALRGIAEGGAEGSLQEAGLCALYLAGMPFAESDARKLNAGGALLTRAVLAVTGASEEELAQAYRRHGDLGAAAFELLGGMGDRVAELGLSDVAGGFEEIAGARTTVARASSVEMLLRRATPVEVKYLVKLMLGDMRIGVKQSLVEEAIALAAGVEVGAVRHAVMLEADLAWATERAFGGSLGEARMRLFHPLGFMLASPVESPEEAVARFTEKPEGRVEAYLEDKFDGMRAQIHCGDPAQPGRVAIYSRNREDITESFPELVEAFAQVKADFDGPMILDGEILAWNFARGKEDEGAQHALPFAVLGSRIGRKKISNEVRAEIPVVFMAFDLLYAKGELQLEHPLRVRRNRLEAIVEQMVDRIVAPFAAPLGGKDGKQPTMFLGETGAGVPRLMLSPSRLVESAEDIDRAYGLARARANEGVMLKAAGSAYLPGRRGLAWVKLKRELATLDVVVTGAEFGHGRRAGVLSDYTFAVRGPEGGLLNVGKAYSGLTDVEIEQLTGYLKEHTVEDQGHFRTVEPLVILEVAFNNVMRSGRHASGFALRFPRIVRIRTDKPVEEIDTLDRVEEVYLSQVDRPVA